MYDSSIPLQLILRLHSNMRITVSHRLGLVVQFVCQSVFFLDEEVCIPYHCLERKT